MFPVPQGRLVRNFRAKGPRWSLGYHTGIDIQAPEGAPVIAARGGKVVYAGQGVLGSSLGAAVQIFHAPSQTYDSYCHLSNVSVKPGQTVKIGESLGKVGQTGNATGPHLHFECGPRTGWAGSSATNPMVAVDWAGPARVYEVVNVGPRSHLNARRGPGTGFAAVASLSLRPGQTVKIAGTSGRWACTPAAVWYCLDYLKPLPKVKHD